MIEIELITQQFSHKKCFAHSPSPIDNGEDGLICLIQSLYLFDFVLSSDDFLCHNGVVILLQIY